MMFAKRFKMPSASLWASLAERFFIERKPENLKEIRGVAFHDETKVPDIVHTGWRELMDLSKVPFAYSNLTEFKNRIIY